MVSATTTNQSYDVVIIGGAMIGASVAWYLSDNPGFEGRILVVEKDPSYVNSSTAHSNSCMRQQFSNQINVLISQYAAKVTRDFRELMGGGPEIPDVSRHDFGYLYLADSSENAALLRENQKIQAACGAGTKLLTPAELATAFPFFNLDGIALASLGTKDEGFFDGNVLFEWWRKKARQNGVVYLQDEVVGMTRSGNRITGVSLKSGAQTSAGVVVNASGPSAAKTAQMAGVTLPVEPRKRYTYVFEADPLGRDLPLTVDPSGVHVRTDGKYYMCGFAPDEDPAVDVDDFAMDQSLWESKAWPAIANRIPAFERLRVLNSWVGHYAFNTFDQNAIIGWHNEVENLMFVNGFSGHGFQQAPAMGRGVAELIANGGFQTLDLSALAYDRIVSNDPLIEKAVI